jgi:ABC-type branched-subunit amino acid transport system permease subunit
MNRNLLLVLGVIALVIVSGVLTASDYIRYVASLWLVFAIAAIGLQIPIGLGAIYSFGHGAFMLIGAYATGLGVVAGLPVPLAMFAGVVVACTIGAVLALPSLRLSGFALAIVTMGAATVMFQGVKAFKVTGGPQGLFMPAVPFVKLAEGKPFFLCIFALLAIGALVSHSVESGPIGRSLRAAAANPLMAQTFGVHLLKVRTTAFVLSAAYGAVSGGLLALLTGYVAPEAFSPELSIQIFAAVMIGGSSRFWGPILGALFIVLIPELTQKVQNMGAMVYAILFTLVATLYPGGLAQLIADGPGRWFARGKARP